MIHASYTASHARAPVPPLSSLSPPLPHIIRSLPLWGSGSPSQLSLPLPSRSALSALPLSSLPHPLPLSSLSPSAPACCHIRHLLCLDVSAFSFPSPEFSKEDMAKSLLHMISNDIGQLACLHARLHSLDRVYFGGFFIRGHPVTMRTITYSINFFSKVTGAPPSPASDADPQGLQNQSCWSDTAAAQGGREAGGPGGRVAEKPSTPLFWLVLGSLHFVAPWPPESEQITSDEHSREFWGSPPICAGVRVPVPLQRRAHPRPRRRDLWARDSPHGRSYLTLSFLRTAARPLAPGAIPPASMPWMPLGGFGLRSARPTRVELVCGGIGCCVGPTAARVLWPWQGEVQALFLRHEGYLGAIGAFLKGAEQDSELRCWCP